ncbi:MAG TPA: lipopolysaccharide heptosyltransferase II [Candidatus Binataceae bacterium]|nr:lipopolysaccharide heptosyltransferase II [Candidatus Binataceae bacterium]
MSASAKIAEASAPSRVTPAPQRIVIKAVNWLGDLVMSLPAMRAVRHAWPEAHLAVLVKRELAGFFDGADWVDEVIGYRLGRGLRGLTERRAIVGDLRRRSFDLAVLMPNSFDSAVWVTAAGIRHRAGFIRDARGAMLTHKALPPRDALDGHQVRYWLAMVRDTIGVTGDSNDFALTPSESNAAKIQDWLAAHRKRSSSSLVALAPAAAYGPAKEWPASKFAETIDLLDSRFGAECVLVGAPSERARCEEVARLGHASTIIAAGETSIGELIALLARCAGFVGNDSGVMHLAGALGIPTIGIFGSTNPLRTGPLGYKTRVLWRHLSCSPCLARTCRFGHYDCLTQVSANEAVDALESIDGFAPQSKIS